MYGWTTLESTTLLFQDGTTPLPVGLMITGKHFEDDKVLDIGFGIEKLVAS